MNNTVIAADVSNITDLNDAIKTADGKATGNAHLRSATKTQPARPAAAALPARTRISAAAMAVSATAESAATT